MSTIHDTPNLKPYVLRNTPTLDDSLLVFLINELRTISASHNALVTAAKALEVRLVAGGL